MQQPIHPAATTVQKFPSRVGEKLIFREMARGSEEEAKKARPSDKRASKGGTISLLLARLALL